MEKNISVVKRLKYYFDILGKEFGSHIDLNKTSPKTYRGETSKGVESDYIRIYKMGVIDKKSFNFAFAITNPEDSEKSLIQVTYKIGEDILASKIYKLEAFKEKMKEFVNLIAILKSINNKNSESIKESIHVIFEFDSKKLTDSDILNECKEKIAEASKEIDASLKKTEKSHNSVKNKRKKLNLEIDSLKNKRIKELGIDELRKKLKILEAILIDGLKEKNKEDNELRQKEITLNYALSNIRMQKWALVQNLLIKYPSNIRKMYEKESK